MTIIDKTINYLFKGTLIILPLFFLPFNLIADGMDSFGKSFFLYASVLTLMVLLIYGKQKNGDRKYRLSYLGFLFLSFVFVLSVSALFGVDPRTSFLGSEGMTLSVLNYVSLFFLYFFIINYVKSERKFKSAVKSLILSYFISVWTVFLAFLFKWLGALDSNSEIFSIINAQSGSFEDFSIYLSVMSVFILGFSIHKSFEILPHFWLLKVTWIVGLFLLALINFIPAWILMILSLILFALNIYKAKLGTEYKLPQLKRITALFILLSAVMLVMNFTFTGQSGSLKSRLATNFHLDFVNSRLIAIESFKDNPILGQGGENYKIAFSKYRSSKMNNLAWWDKRFKKSFSYICDVFVATGFVGFILFLVFLSSILFVYMKLLGLSWQKKNEPKIHFFHNVFFLGVQIVFSFFLYNTNINLLFVFVVILGISNFIVREFSIKEMKFSEKIPKDFFIKKEKERVFMIVLGLLFVLSFLTLAYRTKAVFAQISFENSNEATDLLLKEKMLVDANNMNPKQVNYKIALSRFYKNKIDKIIKDSKKLKPGSFEEELNLSIMAGKNAISLAPNSVQAYELLALIYRDIADFSPDSRILSITAFERASELEPTNPVLFLELAKLYFDAHRIDKAEEAARKSLAMKEDFLEAKFFLSLLMIESGNFEEALDGLKSMEGSFLDVSVRYEIGRIYFNQKDYIGAKEKFSEVIKLHPTHSNALYSLALSFEKLNRASEALVYYKKVLNLNPDNADLRKKVMELER